MDEQREKKRVYAPLKLWEYTFPDGEKVLNMAFNVAQMIPFSREHRDHNGWINLVIKQRRELGSRSETHAAFLRERKKQ